MEITKRCLYITVEGDLSDEDALNAVLLVVRRGRISNRGKLYCYASETSNAIEILADQTRHGNDKFLVRKSRRNVAP